MTALPTIDPRRTARQRNESTDGSALRVVAPRRGGRRVLWVVAALVVVVVAIASAVALNAVAADDAVAVAEIDARIRQAEAHHGQLLTEVATLESPARIAAAAAALGLVRVDHPRQLHVERLVPADGIVHDDDLTGRGDSLKPLLAQD